MNLYEIKNMETGQIVASTVLLKEAAKLLDCPAYAISNAYHSNYAIYGKYKNKSSRYNTDQKKSAMGRMGFVENLVFEIMQKVIFDKVLLRE
ncbi:MAG: hypothetical protein ACLU5B_00140 [Mediterraneibacter faecis]